MPTRLIIKRRVPSAVKSDMAVMTASGGTDVITKYLMEIIKYVGIAVCQWRPAVMMEFYPNHEAVSSVAARLERLPTVVTRPFHSKPLLGILRSE
jgi:hypothetical protein